MMKAALALALAALFLAQPASAQNRPCSGKKGGISHCEGQVFVCNDGSASGSTRSCPAYTGTAGTSAQTLLAAPAVVRSGCSCSSGAYCTGPRGGRYCMTSGGSKRYMRK